MFIKITKSGPRQYIQLVEAYRDDDGTTRHRQVANLGRLDQAKGKLDRLIDGLSRAAGRAPPEVPTFERALEVGGPWVLSSLWNRLGLSRCLRGLTCADAKLNLDALTRVSLTATNALPTSSAASVCSNKTSPLRQSFTACPNASARMR